MSSIPWVRKIPWRRKWLPTPVFLPRKSRGQRSLAGYSPWGHKEWDMTERLTLSLSQHTFSNWINRIFSQLVEQGIYHYSFYSLNSKMSYLFLCLLYLKYHNKPIPATQKQYLIGALVVSQSLNYCQKNSHFCRTETSMQIIRKGHEAQGSGIWYEVRSYLLQDLILYLVTL